MNGELQELRSLVVSLSEQVGVLTDACRSLQQVHSEDTKRLEFIARLGGAVRRGDYAVQNLLIWSRADNPLENLRNAVDAAMVRERNRDA